MRESQISKILTLPLVTQKDAETGSVRLLTVAAQVIDIDFASQWLKKKSDEHMSKLIGQTA